MQASTKLILVLATAAFAGGAVAQTATTSVGRAASAAVTPGDQDMGRNPTNRTGGLMGNDRMGNANSEANRNANRNADGSTMTSDDTTTGQRARSARAARADRG